MPDLCRSAVEACRRYEGAAADVARLTKEIGDALKECPTLDPETRFADEFGPMPGNWTHLKAVYKAVVPREPDDAYRTTPDYAGRLFAGDEAMPAADIPGFPGDPPADMSCPHCLKAHRAIQERKAARQRLGSAKRYVRSVGKRAGAESRE